MDGLAPPPRGSLIANRALAKVQSSLILDRFRGCSARRNFIGRLIEAMSVEAVIWDFGGVFTTSPFEAFNHYEARHRLPKDLIRRVNSTNPDSNAWALFERGEIDSHAFDRKFLEESTALGHPVRGA